MINVATQINNFSKSKIKNCRKDNKNTSDFDDINYNADQFLKLIKLIKHTI